MRQSVEWSSCHSCAFVAQFQILNLFDDLPEFAEEHTRQVRQSGSIHCILYNYFTAVS